MNGRHRIILETEDQENECEHDDHEEGHCLDCGEELLMRYEFEHDSGDMER